MPNTYLTEADLNFIHGETLAEMKQDRLMKNIAARAAAFRAVKRHGGLGYTCDQFANGAYHVWGPQGQHYFVVCDPAALGNSCDCPCCVKHGTCKHLQAVAHMIDEQTRDEAAINAYEARMADAETSEGCDRYARF